MTDTQELDNISREEINMSATNATDVSIALYALMMQFIEEFYKNESRADAEKFFMEWTAGFVSMFDPEGQPLFTFPEKWNVRAVGHALAQDKEIFDMTANLGSEEMKPLARMDGIEVLFHVGFNFLMHVMDTMGDATKGKRELPPMEELLTGELEVLLDSLCQEYAASIVQAYQRSVSVA